MQLIEHKGDTSLYLVEDDSEEGKPVYLKFIWGNYGPWIEVHKEDPREDDDNGYRLPENQVNIDYFECKVRARVWQENEIRERGHEDLEPRHIYYLMTQDAVEENDDAST